jgi:chaperonin GroES
MPTPGEPGPDDLEEWSNVNDKEKKNMAQKIRPLHDRIIVERISADEVSKGGIIIPETAREKPVEGRIIAVGKGAILADGTVRPLDVRTGDRVMFAKHAGTEVTVDGSKLTMLHEEEILGVIEEC